MADKEPASFMKMDVEGFEVEVLHGATQTLRSLRSVFLELHGDILSRAEIRDVLDMLKDAGLIPVSRSNDSSVMPVLVTGIHGSPALGVKRTRARR